MDGVHDLGGRQGFGRIDVGEPEEPFHEAWEGRVMGMVRAISRPLDWNIDKFRFTRENIEPVDYLTRPYYDQWLQSYAAMLVGSGIATVEELASGHAATGPVTGLRPPMPPEAVAKAKRAATRFDREYGQAPAFREGDLIRAKPHGAIGHTRLPAYVRGRRGEIFKYHGAFVLPDASARGEERAEPLYSVAFEAAELWPEAAGRRERVYLDLWESYLDKA